MEGHRANLANVVIGDGVVLHSAALADPEFESENGIGDFLDDTNTVSVIANTMEVNADGPADVRLENVPQFAIHKLNTICMRPRPYLASFRF